MIRQVVVAAGLALLGLAGCTSIAPQERTLRISTTSDLPTLNPLVSDNASLSLYAELWHGYLLRTDERGRLIPDLAVAVPTLANGGISRDGRTITYRLRSGVKWQDGAPFDARDVVFSFHAALNPRNNVPDRSGFDDVARVDADGATTVRVHLKRPFSPAVATFFTTGANDPYAVLPAHLLAKLSDLNQAPYNALPVGLGPYKVVRWERGSRVVMERDPSYFRGPARIRRVELAIVPNQNTQSTEFRSGDLDVIEIRGFGGTQAMLNEARAVPHTTAKLADHYMFNYFMFNLARAPLDERAVRRAIVQGVDGERIMHDLRGDLNRPGSGDRLPGAFAYDASIRQTPYDLAAAKAILDAAGWKQSGAYRSRDGKKLALEITTVAGSSLSERIGVQMQSALRDLGIDAAVKAYDYAHLLNPIQDGGVWAGGKFDVTFYGWQPGDDDDHSYLFRCDTRPPNGENYSRLCDPAIDRDARFALTTVDRTAEAAADRRILRRIEDDADVMFLGFDREGTVWRDDLVGVKPTILGREFWNVADWRFTDAP